MGVHSKAPSCGAWGSAQLHVHHMHVGEAGASRVVSLAGPVPAQTPNQLSSPEISHKHPDHTVEAQAGGSQGSSRHGVGVAGSKWAESTDRAFIQHSARPAAVRCRQGSLKPEAIRMCGHSNTEALEVRARVRGPWGLCRPPLDPGEPTGPHLEASSCIQSADVLSTPQGPPGHKHSMVPLVRGLQEPLFCGLVSEC